MLWHGIKSFNLYEEIEANLNIGLVQVKPKNCVCAEAKINVFFVVNKLDNEVSS